ncbi:MULTISPECIES: BLUF domain-containing protein [Sphingomonas]|uniref:BLUF domain-containing protein n=1 Tax=Sphingomonas TaxID=13687 RepID=UPI000DEF593F|nr:MULTISPECIES: BLUF domain-containing protein [Sphingomonas]
MLQLVYISSAREVITGSTCATILEKSRANNSRDDVTGLLVAGERRFLQALEGPTEAVRSTYARIIQDHRHYACVLLSEQYVENRQFAAWSMGFVSGGSEMSDDQSLAQIVTRLVNPISDASLRAQFIGFAELQDQAA